MARGEERTESEEVKLSQMESGCWLWVGWRLSESNSCEVVPQRCDSEMMLCTLLPPTASPDFSVVTKRTGRGHPEL